MKFEQKYLWTGLIVLVAILVVLVKYWDYVANPWTRDGQVRAKVVQITPRVSGRIVELVVQDNQFVKESDLLFQIDPRTYKASLEQAQAKYDKTRDSYFAQVKNVEAAKAQVEVTRTRVLQAQIKIKELDAEIEKNKAEYARQQELLPKKATSQKSLERARANYQVSVQKRSGAEANVAEAKANLIQAGADLAEAKANLGEIGDANASIREARAAVEEAKLNLEFTTVVAPADGYVTNLNLWLGSQAVTNKPAMAFVDVNSFWVHGFFRENTIEHMRKGNKAIVTLMSYPNSPMEGHVDSLGWGIAQQDGSTGTDLLPNVSPTFEWIRLAQRIPVRIHLDKVPKDVQLRVGTTASVLVMTDTDTSQ